MRLIDADALKQELQWCLEQSSDTERWRDVIERVDAVPTVEPKTGWWRKRDSWMPGREQETKHFPIYECSECGWCYRIRLMSEFCYCPHCGAAMAEGESYEAD